MKFINSKIHGIIDYCVIFMLSASPFLFGFEEESVHCRLLMVTALLLLLISLLTDFEYFLVKIFSFKIHLVLDILLGIFLATSPLTFNLSGNSILPHIVLGIVIVSLGIFTKTTKSSVNNPKTQEELHPEILAQD